MFIAMYDEEDNIVTIFESTKECAKYFNTSMECIRSYFSNVKAGRIRNRKHDKKTCKWYKLYHYAKEEVK